MSAKMTAVSEIVLAVKSTGKVSVKFKKISDGTDRIMFCTLNFGKIPKEHYPKNVTASEGNPKILKVYDLEKKGWRSIPLDRLEWLKVNDTKYDVVLEEWE